MQNDAMPESDTLLRAVHGYSLGQITGALDLVSKELEEKALAASAYGGTRDLLAAQERSAF